MRYMSELDAKTRQETTGESEPKRCQLCGEVLVNTVLNDHDIERAVCHTCYALEVTAGDTW